MMADPTRYHDPFYGDIKVEALSRAKSRANYVTLVELHK